MTILAVASLVLGIISVLAAIGFGPVPIGFTLPIPVIGLILGIVARKSRRKGMAITGAVLSGLALLYFVVSFILFALFP
jgi:hypothetical protein